MVPVLFPLNNKARYLTFLVIKSTNLFDEKFHVGCCSSRLQSERCGGRVGGSREVGRTDGPLCGATIRCNDDEEMTEPSASKKFKLNESSD